VIFSHTVLEELRFEVLENVIWHPFFVGPWHLGKGVMLGEQAIGERLKGLAAVVAALLSRFGGGSLNANWLQLAVEINPIFADLFSVFLGGEHQSSSISVGRSWGSLGSPGVGDGRGDAQDFTGVFVVWFCGARIILWVLGRMHVQLTTGFSFVTKAGWVLAGFFVALQGATLLFGVQPPGDSVTHRRSVADEVHHGSFTSAHSVLTCGNFLLAAVK
jgi:hypothetical protein